MDPNNLEKLFLFEFLVDHVCIYNSKLELTEDVLLQLGPIIIKFQFLNYPVIEVCEEDFALNTKPLSDEKRIYFKSGRSCMFSMNSAQSKILNDPGLDLKLSVFRRPLRTAVCQENIESNDDYLIGNTKVNLSDIFSALFEKSTNISSSKMSHTKTAAHKLLNIYGHEVGKIVFLIRISCFGYMVITGFQLSEEDQKKFKIKHIGLRNSFDMNESSNKDKTNSPPEGEKNDDVEKPAKSKKGVSTPRPGKTIKKSSKDQDKRKGSISGSCPYGYPNNICGCACTCIRKPICCPCQGQQQVLQSNQGQYNQFQGFSTNANSSFSYPPAFGQGVMDPNQGLYQIQPQSPQQQLIQPNTPFTPITANTQQSQYKDMDIDPGSVGIRGNQLVFRMPDKQTTDRLPMENKFATSVYYKMNGENEEGARNVIQVVPDKSKCIPELLPNDKQDVFVLKLGKKRMAAGKKPKLELELKTPKMKEEKPETETQCTQYLESDIPKPPKSPKSKPGTADSKKSKGKKKK